MASMTTTVPTPASSPATVLTVQDTPFWETLSDQQKVESVNEHRSRKLGEKVAWQPAGLVSQYWTEKVYPAIKAIINDKENYERIFSKTSVQLCQPCSLYMVGNTGKLSSNNRPWERARPTIVSICPKRRLAQKLSKLLESIESLKRLNHGFDFMYFEDKKLVLTGTNMGDDHSSSSMPSPGGFCGLPVLIGPGLIDDPEEWRKATIGGTINIDGTLYGISTAHSFLEAPSGDSASIQSNDSDSSGSHQQSTASMSDTCPRETTPRLLSGAIFRRMGVFPVSAYDKLQAKMNQPLYRHSIGWMCQPLLRLQNSSEHRDLGRVDDILCVNMDWALIKLTREYQNLPDKTNTFISKSNNIIHVTSISQERPSGPVCVVAGTSGVFETTCAGSVEGLVVPGSSEMIDVCTVDAPSLPGDCGSWVIDTSSGVCHGMIIATSYDGQQSYFVPAKDIFESIKSKWPSETRIELPCAKDFERQQKSEVELTAAPVAPGESSSLTLGMLVQIIILTFEDVAKYLGLIEPNREVFNLSGLSDEPASALLDSLLRGPAVLRSQYDFEFKRFGGAYAHGDVQAREEMSDVLITLQNGFITEFNRVRLGYEKLDYDQVLSISHDCRHKAAVCLGRLSERLSDTANPHAMHTISKDLYPALATQSLLLERSSPSICSAQSTISSIFSARSSASSAPSARSNSLYTPSTPSALFNHNWTTTQTHHSEDLSTLPFPLDEFKNPWDPPSPQVAALSLADDLPPSQRLPLTTTFRSSGPLILPSRDKTLGFCKSAVMAFLGLEKRAFRYTYRAISTWSTLPYWQCERCTFEGPCNINRADKSTGKRAEKLYDMTVRTCIGGGILYRWVFLAKCHVAMKRIPAKPEQMREGELGSFGCIFCTCEAERAGWPMNDDSIHTPQGEARKETKGKSVLTKDASRPTPIFGNVEDFMDHLQLHRREEMRPGTEMCGRMRAVVGRAPDKDEDFDLCLLPLAEEQAAQQAELRKARRAMLEVPSPIGNAGPELN